MLFGRNRSSNVASLRRPSAFVRASLLLALLIVFMIVVGIVTGAECTAQDNEKSVWKHSNGMFVRSSSNPSAKAHWTEYDANYQTVAQFSQVRRELNGLVLTDEGRDITLFLADDLCGIEKKKGSGEFERLHTGSWLKVGRCGSK